VPRSYVGVQSQNPVDAVDRNDSLVTVATVVNEFDPETTGAHS
jgi:hypothetical protein